MKPKRPQEKPAKFLRAAEGIVQNQASRSYYAYFRHKGKKVMQRLGTKRHPCTSLAEAKRLQRDLRKQLEHTDVAASKKTLQTIIKEYKARMPFEQSTRLYKINYLGQLEKHFPKTTRVAEIKESDMELFLAKFNDQSADRRNKVLTVCRDLFLYAIKDKAIAVSPVEGVKYKTSKAVATKPIPSWTEFESIVKSVREVVHSDTGNESADLIEFMGLAGLGQAECAAMTWGDINFNTESISVIRKKTGERFSVPIYPQLRPQLERMNSERTNPLPGDRVFKVKDPKKALESACKRLKLPKYSARDFRKMFITRCLERGIDAQTIADWQGHQDGGVLILQVYGKVTSKHKKDMAALLTKSTKVPE